MTSSLPRKCSTPELRGPTRAALFHQHRSKPSTTTLYIKTFTTLYMERVMGIEPTSSAWKAEVLPLNYTRLSSPQPTFSSLVRYKNAVVKNAYTKTLPNPEGQSYPCIVQIVFTSCYFSQHTPPENWWRGQDSNLRRLSQQIYSLPPLTAWVPLRDASRALSGLGRAVSTD